MSGRISITILVTTEWFCMEERSDTAACSSTNLRQYHRSWTSVLQWEDCSPTAVVLESSHRISFGGLQSSLYRNTKGLGLPHDVFPLSAPFPRHFLLPFAHIFVTLHP